MLVETISTLSRILIFYLIVVALLFAGFMTFARANVATRGQKGIKRYLIYLIGLIYFGAGILFLFDPQLAIIPALVAIILSVVLGFVVLGSRQMRRSLAEPELALLFVLPSVIGIFLFYYYQIAQTVIYSLHSLDHTTDWTWETFVGLENYYGIFTSKNFLRAFGYTLYFTIVSVFLEFWIGLGMAMATFQVGRRLTGVLRSVIVIPWAIPPIISAAIWKWLFNADVGMGYFLVQIGLVEEPPLFLADPILAMHSVILAEVWQMSSMIAIFMIGGLAIIPQDIYDAAKVDGARAFYRFRRITLPMLTPTILVALLYKSIFSLRTFDLVYGLTNGGPGIATETLNTFAYKFYFSRAKFGIGSAYGMVIFLVALLVSLFYVQRMRKNLRFKSS
jgi:ABC-type sugar transport system permease subunit